MCSFSPGCAALTRGYFYFSPSGFIVPLGVLHFCLMFGGMCCRGSPIVALALHASVWELSVYLCCPYRARGMGRTGLTGRTYTDEHGLTQTDTDKRFIRPRWGRGCFVCSFSPGCAALTRGYFYFSPSGFIVPLGVLHFCLMFGGMCCRGSPIVALALGAFCLVCGCVSTPMGLGGDGVLYHGFRSLRSLHPGLFLLKSLRDYGIILFKRMV